MLTETLTGNKRHRVQTTTLGSAYYLVLQVEVHKEGYEVTDSYGGSKDWNHTYWRDAKLEDISLDVK